jgi:hypothetical protein
VARSYTIVTAALALGVSTKWLDNTLSHFRVPGVHQERQGIARRLSVDAILTLAAAILLAGELGIPIGRGLELAMNAVAAGGPIATDPRLQVSIDLLALQLDLQKRLEHAVEVAPLPRRGRPPKNTTGRLD